MRFFWIAALAALPLLACNQAGSDDASENSGSQDSEQNGLTGTNGDHGSDAQGDSTATPKDPILVRAETVVQQDIDRRLEITARVESLDVVDVLPEHAETVKEIYVEEGDLVEKNQILALLDTADCQLNLDEAKVRVQEAEDALAQANRDYERNKKLADSPEGSLLSERDVETSEQAVRAATTARDAFKVAVTRAEVALERCTIRAELDGTITAREISTGDRSTIGMRMFEIVDLAAPKAIFYRPQRELADLKVGQPLTATSEALPGRVIQGRIERISPTIDPLSGTVKVTAALDPAGEVIPRGVLIEIELVLDVHEQALLIPKRALLYEARSPYCFVVRNDKAVRCEVRGGFENPEFLEALPSEGGVNIGDRVVVVGADRLAPGDPIVLAEE